MMAYGDDSEMHERLLGSDSEAVREHLPNAVDDSTMTMSDDEHSDEYELISERETLVFDQALFTARQQYDSGGDGNGSKESFFQAYLMNKIQPGSGALLCQCCTSKCCSFFRALILLVSNVCVNDAVKGSMFTMTVAIVGAGVLALPYAVEQVRHAAMLFEQLYWFLHDTDRTSRGYTHLSDRRDWCSAS